ncbi:MAG: hypothetical protein ABT11_13465 [Novosphingobium sp. SCN 66-18]|nr:MAG: hypothetical protein ABT11_13465 [Novosphingobium sp. SCN 66-18]
MQRIVITFRHGDTGADAPLLVLEQGLSFADEMCSQLEVKSFRYFQTNIIQFLLRRSILRYRSCFIAIILTLRIIGLFILGYIIGGVEYYIQDSIYASIFKRSE